MYAIDNATAVATRPTPAAPGPVPGGFFATATPGTIVDGDWMNAVQTELLAILAAAGVAPSKVAVNQVLAAIQELYGAADTAVLAAVTTELNNAFQKNASGSTGSQTLWGGLILQFFELGFESDSSGTNTFPVAFPNACYWVGISLGAPFGAVTELIVGAAPASRSSYNWQINAASAGADGCWVLAIGA